jgi:hypothetical protein
MHEADNVLIVLNLSFKNLPEKSFLVIYLESKLTHWASKILHGIVPNN